MRINFVLLFCAIVLAGCVSQSDTQRDYVVAQAECQDEAQSDIDAFAAQNQEASSGDRNAQIVKLFSDCMTKRGWQLTRPKKSAEVASAPAGSPAYLPNQPSATATAAAAKPSQPTAASVAPSSIPSAPTGAPSLPQTSGGSAPATYQPSYGTGPGRGF